MDRAQENLFNIKERISRRSFLGWFGFVGLAVSGIMGGIINLLFLKPEVNYGPPTIFTAGKSDEYKVGTSQIFENEKVLVAREKEGLMAISLTCTHLGCTVRTSSAGFECPCHGSQFDNLGSVTGGPAPDNLSWYQISITPGGELEIDKSVKIKQGNFFTA